MDILILINEYLEQNKALKHEDDSLNVCDNVIVSWDFKQVPQPTQEQLDALIPVVQAKDSKQAKLEEIKALEASLTPRKMREALISGDMSEVQKVEGEIAAIRSTL